MKKELPEVKKIKSVQEALSYDEQDSTFIFILDDDRILKKFTKKCIKRLAEALVLRASHLERYC